MNRSESIKNLAEALSLFQSQVESAKKTSSNPFFKSKYADLASIWETIRQPLTDNGLSVVQTGAPSEPGMLSLETILLHKSGEWISGIITLNLVVALKDGSMQPKTDPQSTGSAITYARRYGLAAILGIYQEDDDANALSGGSKESQDARLAETKAAIKRGLDALSSFEFDAPTEIKKFIGQDSVDECKNLSKLTALYEHLRASYILLKDRGEKSPTPEAATPEPAKQEHAPVSYTPIQIAQATKEANDALAKVSMTGNKVMEFRAAIKAAAADKNVEALNNLRDNILAQVKTKIEEAEYTVMPDASIDLKGKIIETVRKLEGIYGSATYSSNSVRKHLGIEVEKTDWVAAVTACDCTPEKLAEALKYWEDALARAGKKAESPRDFKKEALAAIAKMPEGDVKAELLARATQEDADFEELLQMAGEKW